MRWISDRLGTAAYGDASIPSGSQVLDVRHLVDKGGNTLETVEATIAVGCRLLAQGATVVVTCDYGMSRSNAVAAAILSRSSGKALPDAVLEVLKRTGETAIRLDVLDTVLATALPSEPNTAQQGQRILVTGGSGTLGRELIRQASGVLDIVAPSRDEFDLLNDAAALSVFARQNGIRTVVHLANPRIYSTNTSVGESLSALRNVLEVSASIGAGFFFASGWEVFSGYRVRELIAPNDLTPRPRGPYGEAKALAEQLIAWFVANHGLRSAVLRLSPVYGHGVARPKFIYNFIHKALAGEPIQTHRYRNGEPRLALLHVTDAGAGILGALQQQISGVLNLGGEALVSTTEVARFIVDRLDSASPLDSVHVDADWANVLLDNDPASDRLGWRPRISWQQGLASIIDGELQRHRDREKSE